MSHSVSSGPRAMRAVIAAFVVGMPLTLCAPALAHGGKGTPRASRRAAAVTAKHRATAATRVGRGAPAKWAAEHRLARLDPVSFPAARTPRILSESRLSEAVAQVETAATAYAKGTSWQGNERHYQRAVEELRGIHDGITRGHLQPDVLAAALPETWTRGADADSHLGRSPERAREIAARAVQAQIARMQTLLTQGARRFIRESNHDENGHRSLSALRDVLTAHRHLRDVRHDPSPLLGDERASGAAITMALRARISIEARLYGTAWTMLHTAHQLLEGRSAPAEVVRTTLALSETLTQHANHRATPPELRVHLQRMANRTFGLLDPRDAVPFENAL